MSATMTHADRFEAFHRSNPQVFDRLKTMCLDLRSRGFTRWGIKNLWEKLRFDLAIDTTSPDYRLNNNYHSHYARLLMAEVSELAGFFQLRK